MKEEWKICKNPKCKEKFYKDEMCTTYQWGKMVFHNRSCQAKFYNEKRRGKRKYTLPNSINFQALHDACNKYNREARERLKDQVIIYSSENMTQEELQILIPSMRR